MTLAAWSADCGLRISRLAAGGVSKQDGARWFPSARFFASPGHSWADELILVAPIYEHAAWLRSFELAAQAMRTVGETAIRKETGCVVG
jgi:hypothetical protein